MSGGGETSHAGPDLGTDGVELSEIPEGGMVGGHFVDQPVLLLRKGSTVYAMGAKCTHYGGPLHEGVFDGECVRCPWHRACFRPESGEALHAPAFDSVPTYTVVQRGTRILVTGQKAESPARPPLRSSPASVIIVGGGAAGFAAAELLRREGYPGPVTMISSDDAGPYDRPNVSKDYLAGTAPEEWIPLRGADWYQTSRIELLTGRRATELATDTKTIRLDDGRRIEYGALLLATGASPLHLDLPGGTLPHVRYLRTLHDSRTIIERAQQARRAVVVGASFIGLEVAASLRTRNLEVHVVAPEDIPMQRVLGAELGRFVKNVHEEHGVRFHMGQTITAIDEQSVTLKDGTRLDADLVVIGVGVRPNLELAERAGLRLDRGVAVDEYLGTSAPDVWAAGDIARWPDRYSGERIRVEHWVVAERQGQTAARNILGWQERFAATPFFWSMHYDVPITYVGHATSWDDVAIEGRIADRDCLVAYRKQGKTVAAAAINRDVQSLRIQIAMEQGDGEAVEAAVRGW